MSRSGEMENKWFLGVLTPAVIFHPSSNIVGEKNEEKVKGRLS
jgi:hypothetical protein